MDFLHRQLCLPGNSDNLTFLFSFYILFIFFSYLSALAETSITFFLKRSGEGVLTLILILVGKILVSHQYDIICSLKKKSSGRLGIVTHACNSSILGG